MSANDSSGETFVVVVVFLNWLASMGHKMYLRWLELDPIDGVFC